MATGDQGDITSRLQSYLPRNWFGDWASAPIIGGVIAGIASALAAIYALIAFQWAQTRLQTSAGAWIDLWAADFLGSSLPRRLGEADSAYILRVRAAIFQARATRPAMVSMLTNLTGKAPIIFEPMRPLDTGCLGANTGPASFCGVARMGSLAAPFSALITAFRPQVTGGSTGAAYANAIQISAMGVSTPNSYTGSLSAQTSIATDAAIYAAINATKPVGTNVGVAITNA